MTTNRLTIPRPIAIFPGLRFLIGPGWTYARILGFDNGLVPAEWLARFSVDGLRMLASLARCR